MGSFWGALVFAFWLGVQVQARWGLSVTGDLRVIVMDVVAVALYSGWHFGVRLRRSAAAPPRPTGGRGS